MTSAFDPDGSFTLHERLRAAIAAFRDPRPTAYVTVDEDMVRDVVREELKKAERQVERELGSHLDGPELYPDHDFDVDYAGHHPDEWPDLAPEADDLFDTE